MTLLDRVRDGRKALPAFQARQAKTLGQVRYGWGHERRVSFVFGCQRSGTKMVMRILDNSPMTRIYHENHAIAFSDFQLRSDATVRAIIRLNPAPAQIFKPICDSQDADRILSRFPAARAVWMYRHHDDVANSAREKWGAHQREVVGAAVSGDVERWGWRARRVPPAVVEELRRVWRPDLTEAEGALLFWYMRNAFFFALGLDRSPRVRLANYERLVTRPAEEFPALFAHVGADFDPAFISRVVPTSVGRAAAPPASPEIRALVEGLMARLDACQPPARPPLERALILINTLGVGGAERHAVCVANWLAARGTEVDLAASAGELVGELAPAVRFHPAPLRRVRADLPLAAARIRALVVARRPSVILCNSLVMTWIARLASPRGCVVNIAHGWPAAEYRRVGPLLRAANRVVAVSPEVRTRLLAAGLPPERCDVVLNGVDLTSLGPRVGEVRAAARRALGAGPDDVAVVVVGRLTTQKAHHHVVTLAARLRDGHPRVRWAVVGEGTRAAELAGLVREAGLDDRVRMLGLRDDVPDILGSADIYLSCSDWEGMSLTLIEAMAAGLPCVATATEGSGLLVQRDTGVLVPIGDVDGLAVAIGELAADPSRRTRLGQAGRARVAEAFGHGRMMAELEEVLGRVVGR
jgi:glycosyltransferase involved in cell wall biosynthesis